jgi:hypothetical protein
MRWLLVLAFGCGAGAPPVTPPAAGPSPTATPIAMMAAPASDGYTGELALKPLLADLMAQQRSTGAQLRARYAGRAKTMELAGPNLSHPDWVAEVNGPDDVFFAFGADITGLQLWEDHGPYVELAVAKGTLADAEAVIGPTEPLPADAKSGPRVAAYVGQIRVFVELAKSGTDVRRVMIHYEQ